MFNITLNGVSMPSFILVRTVDTAVLPTITHAFKPIAGGRGLREVGTSLGGKMINFKITILPTTGLTTLQMNRELAQWLRGNNFKLSTLVISDEPNMTYMAKVNGVCDVTDLLIAGEGMIEFVVPVGIATSTTIVPVTVDNVGKQFTIAYNGTAMTYPVFTWTPTANFTGVTVNLVLVETGDTVSLTGNFNTGETITVDCSNKVVKRGSVVEMKLVNFSSTWINFIGRGTYHVTWNQAGNGTCTMAENWL
jgi:predicted phage tail component-like protein